MSSELERPIDSGRSYSDIAIKVSNLSKCYHIYEKPRDRLKQFILAAFRRAIRLKDKQYFREFWALRDVSFEIRKGEAVGIIGRNGSGKSTLLQMICGTLNPSGGSIQTHGRIAALLELGAGFNPEFTGRENVYMNASVLGLRKEEIDIRYNDIVAFADIGDFIEQPVKTYSSGMVVRLAFAVQAQIDPDILIVDEALAVGDAKFQAKCFERLRQLKENGTSILLVTHSTEQIVTHCTHAVLLNNGQVIEQGNPRRISNLYLDLLFGKQKRSEPAATEMSDEPIECEESVDCISADYCSLNLSEDTFGQRPGYNPHEYRWGDGAVRILDYYISADGEAYPTSYKVGQEIVLVISVGFLHEVFRPIFGITIKTKEGVTVFGANSETLDFETFKSSGRAGTAVRVGAKFNCRLGSGDYFISIGVASRQGEDILPHDRRYDSIHIQVRPDESFFGLVNLDLKLSASE
jgi:lipopolysaccharide transport system ATP-binding protein|tara:strand:- start:539 stop:1930 length:1392 start_codon:yes stop_codon:yes gene_type:complete